MAEAVVARRITLCVCTRAAGGQILKFLWIQNLPRLNKGNHGCGGVWVADLYISGFSFALTSIEEIYKDGVWLPFQTPQGL